MSKEMEIKQECCNIWNNLKDKTQMIDCLIESKRQITDLEAKLAEKDKTIEAQHNGIGYWKSVAEKRPDIDYVFKIKDLEQQLAEKEKEIEDMKFMMRNTEQALNNVPNAMAGQRKRINELKKELKQANQDKISFALELLNQAKGKIQHNISFVDCDNYLDVIEEIDNQIKQLKEMK